MHEALNKRLRDFGLSSFYFLYLSLSPKGLSHNVYVINLIFDTPEEPANEPPSEDVPSRSETVGARVSDVLKLLRTTGSVGISMAYSLTI